MIDGILAFFRGLPNELYVFVISMLPIVELRGAVPVGAAIGIPFYINYAVSVLGNLLPIPFILLFIPKILDFLAKFKFFRPVVEWVRKKADKYKGKIIKSEISKDGSESTSKKAPRKMTVGAFTALMLFVALPIPGTGAWTGALVASLFGMPKLHSFLAILSGVLICGVIMCLASYGVLGFLAFLL
jgi:uncharacterized membrane protein